MLNINERKMIAGEEIHRAIESKLKRFDLWLKEAMYNADLKEGEDFCRIYHKSTGGRPKVTFEFTIEAAKEICLLERNEKGKQIRRWLIEVETQKENADLLNHEQIIALSAMVGVFKYIENQSSITTKHLSKFVENYEGNSNPYAEFHKLRNSILQISKEEIEKRLKEYCVINSKRLPVLKTKSDKILFIDMYDSLKNAVWDFLYMNGSPTALKMAELAKKMAQAQGISILDKNENNLFQIKESLPEIKQIP